MKLLSETRSSSAMTTYKTYGTAIIWGVALFLFEKCCLTLVGVLLERSVGPFHFFVVEKLLP